jgi:hypothetical protein
LCRALFHQTFDEIFPLGEVDDSRNLLLGAREHLFARKVEKRVATHVVEKTLHQLSDKRCRSLQLCVRHPHQRVVGVARGVEIPLLRPTVAQQVDNIMGK